MKVSYARVEFCGQTSENYDTEKLGKYCLHFHHQGRCPECKFVGNAIEDSYSKGITVHNVHESLVDSNTLFNVRRVGIYIEDGNEMANTISNNALTCSTFDECGIGSKKSGIYVVAATNDFVGNRVSGYHESSLFFNGQQHGNGQGASTGKVCPAYLPLGIVRNNVGHDIGRFSFYIQGQYPRDLPRNSNGHVVDRDCSPFDENGNDRGKVAMIEDQLEYNNNFQGGYSMGDVSFVRYKVVNCNHGLYWKLTKDMVDQSQPHVLDSVFAAIVTDGGPTFGTLSLYAPGGASTFVVKNTRFICTRAGTGHPCGNAGAFKGGQHCGLKGHNKDSTGRPVGWHGTACNTEYLFINTKFELPAGSTTKWVQWSASGSNPLLSTFVTLEGDETFGGYRSLVSPILTGVDNVASCSRVAIGQGTLKPRPYDQDESWWNGDGPFGAYGCSKHVRRLNLWGMETANELTISGPGFIGSGADDSGWRPKLCLGQYEDAHRINFGVMRYDHGQRGYGLLALAGETYTLKFSGNDVAASPSVRRAVTFGSPVFTAFGQASDDFINLNVIVNDATSSCRINASDSHAGSIYTAFDKFRVAPGVRHVGGCNAVFDYTRGWSALQPGQVPLESGPALRLIWTNQLDCVVQCEEDPACNFVLSINNHYCQHFSKCIEPGKTAFRKDNNGAATIVYKTDQVCNPSEEAQPESGDRPLYACDDPKMTTAPDTTSDAKGSKPQYQPSGSDAANVRPGNVEGTTHVVNWELNVGNAGNLKINVGDTVRWVWSKGVNHDVRAGVFIGSRAVVNRKFGCNDAASGDYSHTFWYEGEFPYICTLHTSMVGMITVGSRVVRQCDDADYQHVSGRCSSGSPGCVRDQDGKTASTAWCVGKDDDEGLISSGSCLDKCVFGSTSVSVVASEAAAGGGGGTVTYDGKLADEDPCWTDLSAGLSPESPGALLAEYTGAGIIESEKETDGGGDGSSDMGMAVTTKADCQRACSQTWSCTYAVFVLHWCKLYSSPPPSDASELVTDLATPPDSSGKWLQTTCTNHNMQARGISELRGVRLLGETTGQHGGLPSFCDHCLARCFVQQKGKCVAATFDSARGICTYFKSVSAVIPSDAAAISVVEKFALTLVPTNAAGCTTMTTQPTTLAPTTSAPQGMDAVDVAEEESSSNNGNTNVTSDQAPSPTPPPTTLPTNDGSAPTQVPSDTGGSDGVGDAAGTDAIRPMQLPSVYVPPFLFFLLLFF